MADRIAAEAVGIGSAGEPLAGHRIDGPVRRAAYCALGCLMLALGVIGAFLPVMPTTGFLILAALFFGRSSPRFEAWMLDHPRFGPAIREWREHGAISRRAKLMACAGMTFGFVVLLALASPGPGVAGLVAILMLVTALYLVTRPAVPAAFGNAGDRGKPEGNRSCI